MNPLLTAALKYAKRGWHIFPIWEFDTINGCLCDNKECADAGKHPAVKWGKEATTDAATVREWWTAHPQRGIGIATGARSGISVLDIDGEEGALSLATLQAGEALPATPCVESRPGHQHYYFAYTEKAKQSQGALGAGLDIRNDGGYVVAPPSPHVSGGAYKWLAADATSIADWPDFLVAGGKKKKTRRAEGARESFNPDDEEEVARLKSALEFVDPDIEETWAQVGWILGRAFRQSDTGYAVYAAWAGRSAKYNPRKSRNHYYVASAKPYGGDAVLTTGTIYKWATDIGWVYDDGRPVIVVKEGQLHVQVDAAIGALAAAGDVYTRAGELVEIVEMHEATHSGFILDNAVHRDNAAPIIHQFNADNMLLKLNRLARFERNGKQISCPHPIAASLLAKGQWDGVPLMHAITGSPFPRADGTICDTAGYDKSSHTFLFANGTEILKVPEHPSRRVVRDALSVVREPFSEVPWKESVHESAFIGFMLTLITRPIMPTVPTFIFTAPKPGSGKTLLVDAASVVVHGTSSTKRSYTADLDEQRKVLQSILLAGDPLILFDNVTAGASIGGNSLNTYITAEYVGDRTLGVSESKRITNSSCIAFTGNNIGARADFVRRAIVVEIDSGVEHPERRRFRIANLLGHLRAHRAELLRALLTLLRGFLCDGAPPPSRAALGSFEAWDQAISGCLLWLGLQNPLLTQDTLTTDDPETEITATLYRELARLQPDTQSFTVQDIKHQRNSNADLMMAINAACEGMEQIGYWLRSHRDYPCGGMKLTQSEHRLDGYTRWKIIKLET